MGADANIFQQFAQPVRSVADYMGDADMRSLRQAQLQSATQNNAMQALTMNQARQTMADTQNDNALIRAAYAKSGGDAKALTQELRMAGTPGTLAHADAVEKRIGDAGKVQADTDKSRADAGKTLGETADASIKRYRGALDFIDTPAGATRWLAAQYQDPALGSHMQSMGPLDAAVQRIPQTPQEFKQWRDQAGMGMDAYQKHLQEQAKIAETGRHNVADEGIQADNNKLTNATHVQTAGIAAGATRANNRDTLAQADKHFNAQQNAPKYMETDSGLVVLPTRLAAGQVPVGQPVAGPDGQPLGKPLKALPPAVNDAIIGNSQSLYSMDKAISLLQGKNVDSAKGDTAATGWKGYLPQAMLNRIDAGGVDTRAELSDIGSLKIHDRSGAAVTVSESPRLMPFIPTSTDPPDVAIRKLTRLKEEALRNQQALSDTYSKDQGYKPSPVKPGPARVVPVKTGSGATASNW